MSPPPRKLISCLLALACGLCLAVNTYAQAEPTPEENRAQGIAAYEKGQFASAVLLLKRVVAQDPTDAVAWDYLGNANRKLGALPEARFAYEQAIKLQPSYLPTRVSLADLFFYSGAFDSALAAATAGSAVDPRNAYFHSLSGAVHLRQGRTTEALDQAEQALRLDGRFGDALLLKSQALFKLFLSQPDAKRVGGGDRGTAGLQSAVQASEEYASVAPSEEYAEYWRTQLESLRLLLADSTPGADASRTTLYKAGEVTTRARILAKPAPAYTDQARTAGEAGTVRLIAILGADGAVRRVLVTSPLSAGLNAMAVKAAKEIKFEPATLEGKPVAQSLVLEYIFIVY